MPLPLRHSTEAEIDALEQVCDRLAGFNAEISLEWVDGYLTALVASRRAIPPGEWLEAMFGDDFGRAFADPQDVDQAMQALLGRWNVLARALDPESLIDAPDALRLSPLMITWDDAARAEVVASGQISAEEANEQLQTGALWAEGFRQAVEDFDEDWPEPEDEDSEDANWFADCVGRVMALLMSADELATHLAEQYPGETLERDQLIDEACFGVQDLRLYWVEHAPKPETRRVEAQPGRNDPCPCGSGKKYKKCHGAAA
ncbi:MAG: UPF0149 family protein [Burkholderiaceae bacterium]|nr:UPF0149 family protein [Burkholderiaceae bacterium]